MKNFKNICWTPVKFSANIFLIDSTQMKTGKWFIKPVLQVTIFVKFGGILTALQPESTVLLLLCTR